jgi:hypothetical protein
MNYQKKYRNNPALRLTFQALHHLANFILLSIFRLFPRYPERFFRRHQTLKSIYSGLAILHAALNLEDFEKYLDENNPRIKASDKWVN